MHASQRNLVEGKGFEQSIIHSALYGRGTNDNHGFLGPSEKDPKEDAAFV